LDDPETGRPNEKRENLIASTGNNAGIFKFLPLEKMSFDKPLFMKFSV